MHCKQLLIKEDGIMNINTSFAQNYVNAMAQGNKASARKTNNFVEIRMLDVITKTLNPMTNQFKNDPAAEKMFYAAMAEQITLIGDSNISKANLEKIAKIAIKKIGPPQNQEATPAAMPVPSQEKSETVQQTQTAPPSASSGTTPTTTAAPQATTARESRIENAKKQLNAVPVDREIVNAMVDNLIAKGDIKEFIASLDENQLDKLWGTDTSKLVGLTDIEQRNDRLKAIIPMLSDEQLEKSMGNQKFLQLLDSPHAPSIALTLSAQQFAIVAKNTKSVQGDDLAFRGLVLLLKNLGRPECDNRAEKLQAILDNIRFENLNGLPYSNIKPTVTTLKTAFGNATTNLPERKQMQLQLTQNLTPPPTTQTSIPVEPKSSTPKPQVEPEWRRKARELEIATRAHLEAEELAQKAFVERTRQTLGFNLENEDNDLTRLGISNEKIQMLKAGDKQGFVRSLTNEELSKVWDQKSKLVGGSIKGAEALRQESAVDLLTFLSTEQLKHSMKDEKFYVLLTEKKSEVPKLASQRLTPAQFGIIAKNIETTNELRILGSLLSHIQPQRNFHGGNVEENKQIDEQNKEKLRRVNTMISNSLANKLPIEDYENEGKQLITSLRDIFVLASRSMQINLADEFSEKIKKGRVT